MILYHGTDSKFNKFSKSKIGSNTNVTSVGFFFTDNYNTAKSYGDTVLKCEVDLGAYIECDFDGQSTYYFGEEKWYTPNMLAERIDEINKNMENRMSIEIGDYGKSEIDDENSTDDELVYLYDNSNFTPEDYLDMLGEGGGFDHQCDDKIDSVICKNIKDNMELGGELSNNYIIFDENRIKVLGTVNEDTNLNSNFKRWFKNSKVVDKKGKPLVVYHGTNKSFNSFDKLKRGSITSAKSSMDGFWFTTDKNLAGSYANLADYKSELSTLKRELKRLRNFPLANFKKEDEIEKRIKELEKINTDNKHIISVYLKIENPKIIDAKGQKYNDFEENINQALYNMNGYDGLIVKNLIDVGEDENPSDFKPSTHYMVLSPNQIKSVNNNGEWSDSDNIYEKLNEELRKYL